MAPSPRRTARRRWSAPTRRAVTTRPPARSRSSSCCTATAPRRSGRSGPSRATSSRWPARRAVLPRAGGGLLVARGRRVRDPGRRHPPRGAAGDGRRRRAHRGRRPGRRDLEDGGAGVDVRFKSGAQGRFDIVVGADGLHSNTRALVFGPEAPFSRYLGYCFNLFSLPNDGGLAHEAIIYAEPGRMAGVYAVGNSDTLQAFLTFAADEPPFRSTPMPTSNAAGRPRCSPAAAGKSPVWSRRCNVQTIFTSTPSARSTCRGGPRAAWCWSATPLMRPLSCRDRAAALRWSAPTCWLENWRTHADPVEAFTAYERIARPFVEANQALAAAAGASSCRARLRNSMLATRRSLPRSHRDRRPSCGATRRGLCTAPFAFPTMGTR